MFRQSITFCLFTLLLRSLISTLPGAAPVTVRFVEGAVHGFLTLSGLDGNVLATESISFRRVNLPHQRMCRCPSAKAGTQGQHSENSEPAALDSRLPRE